jgi:hypothetical protein
MSNKFLQLLVPGKLPQALQILLFGDAVEQVVVEVEVVELVVLVLTLAAVVEELVVQVDPLRLWNILSP